MSIQVVILAGGQGTRIRTVAGNSPKSLIPVDGRPFIEHQFDLLRRSGFTEVLLCVGYGATAIESHVGDGSRFGMSVRYQVEDPSNLRGTGGALVAGLPQLRDQFMLLYGDSYLPTDYSPLEQSFRQCGCDALMTVYANRGRWDRSNTCVRDNRVVLYSKNAASDKADAIDYGITFYKRHAIERYINHPIPFDLQIILQDLVTDGQLAAAWVSERFYEVGKPEGWLELNDLLGQSHSPTPRTRPAIFLDRDGTINEMVYDDTHGTIDSPRRPEDVRLRKGAASFIRHMRELGYAIHVITNQPGIAKGTLPAHQLDAIHSEIAKQLAEVGAACDGLYYCPHYPAPTPQGNSAYTRECLCRKPLPGLLYQAAQEHGLSLPHSWMIGDGITDIQAGRSAGCRTVLLSHLKIEQIERFMTLSGAEPDFVAIDFKEAEAILRRNFDTQSHKAQLAD